MDSHPFGALPPTLAISPSPAKGRFLVATTAIPANSLLFLSAPACLFPARSDRCSHCLLPSPTSQCKVCKSSYCSVECQTLAWPDHRHECKLVKSFTSKEGRDKVPPHVWIPMLLLARIFRAASGTPKGQALAPVGAVPLPAPLHYPTLEAVLALQAPTGGDTGVSGMAAGVIALGRSLGLFPATVTDEQLATTHNALQLNNFSPTDESQAPVAFGCYPLAALMNHSCRPNVAISYGFIGGPAWPETESASSSSGSAASSGSGAEAAAAAAASPPVALRQCMAVRTLLPIAKGEEVCHSYVDITLPKEARVGDLAARYGFRCSCPTCASEPAAAAAASEAEPLPGDVQATLARAKAMVMRSREIATEPELELTKEVLQCMSEEGANPPGQATDWQDAEGVIALETAVLVHALRTLLRHKTRATPSLVAGSASRLLEVAQLAEDWATAEALLVFQCQQLLDKPALAPYKPAEGGSGGAGGWPRHPLFTSALLPLSAVYAEYGRAVALGAGGALTAPVPEHSLSRRAVLAEALGLSTESWGRGGLAVPLQVAEGAPPPTAQQLLDASAALAQMAAGVLEGAWGSCALAAKLRRSGVAGQ